jgi:hypothetical protein
VNTPSQRCNNTKLLLFSTIPGETYALVPRSPRLSNEKQHHRISQHACTVGFCSEISDSCFASTTALGVGHNGKFPWARIATPDVSCVALSRNSRVLITLHFELHRSTPPESFPVCTAMRSLVLAPKACRHRASRRNLTSPSLYCRRVSAPPHYKAPIAFEASERSHEDPSAVFVPWWIVIRGI